MEKLGSCESKEAEESIKQAAHLTEDHSMIAKVGNIDFVAKEVKYHHSCRKAYLNAAK